MEWIKLTRLEAEYVLETINVCKDALDADAEKHDLIVEDFEVFNQLLYSSEIIKACLDKPEEESIDDGSENIPVPSDWFSTDADDCNG